MAGERNTASPLRNETTLCLGVSKNPDLAENQQVTHMNDHEQVNSNVEISFHQGLKRDRGIFQTHRHDEILQLSVFRIESRLFDVFRVYLGCYGPYFRM